MAATPDEAGPLALALDDQNRERQVRTQDMQSQAETFSPGDEPAPFLIFAFKREL